MTCPQAIKAELQALIRRHGSQVKAAHAIGVQPSQFGDVWCGRVAPSAGFAAKLGFERQFVFVKASSSHAERAA